MPPLIDMLYGPIENYLYIIRGSEVLLDFDLAALFDMPTKHLNQFIKRHRSHFPAPLRFRLTPGELAYLRVVSENPAVRLRNLRHPPYAFTLRGTHMVSSILRTPLALRINLALHHALPPGPDARNTNANSENTVQFAEKGSTDSLATT